VPEYSAQIWCGSGSRAVERKVSHSDPPPVPGQRQKFDRVSLLGTRLLRKYRGIGWGNCASIYQRSRGAWATTGSTCVASEV